MNLLWKCILCFLVCVSVVAQEKKLKGEVLSLGERLENVHIKNKTTKVVTTTNEEGIFEIQTKAGDTLSFSYVGMENLILIVRERYFEKELYQAKMRPIINELNEVVLYNAPKVDAVSLGIVPKGKKKPTVAERRYRLATTGLIDPIINAISGRTKRMKKHLAAEKKVMKFNYLKENYSDFLQEELDLTEEIIDMFLNYLVDKNELRISINNEEREEIQFFMVGSWVDFKETEHFKKYLEEKEK
ncbi:carboxypeptidase-like regulatory domain-containing protein [Aureivirga sp. CE67]|uniref:carboxypeptidase-like regulatory domain-containing protein n=1 Tax=Aureivirga sp. CE67 TaxID=1788983 RepID=UPI0018CB207A|nr:carboxypeptidase-like regulatory domain-containing protein [Aureivirga sp. CE67]